MSATKDRFVRIVNKSIEMDVQVDVYSNDNDFGSKLAHNHQQFVSHTFTSPVLVVARTSGPAKDRTMDIHTFSEDYSTVGVAIPSSACPLPYKNDGHYENNLSKEQAVWWSSVEEFCIVQDLDVLVDLRLEGVLPNLQVHQIIGQQWANLNCFKFSYHLIDKIS